VASSLDCGVSCLCLHRCTGVVAGSIDVVVLAAIRQLPTCKRSRDLQTKHGQCCHRWWKLSGSTGSHSSKPASLLMRHDLATQWCCPHVHHSRGWIVLELHLTQQNMVFFCVQSHISVTGFHGHASTQPADEDHSCPETCLFTLQSSL
jgi:hypothetical protein